MHNVLLPWSLSVSPAGEQEADETRHVSSCHLLLVRVFKVFTLESAAVHPLGADWEDEGSSCRPASDVRPGRGVI